MRSSARRGTEASALRFVPKYAGTETIQKRKFSQCRAGSTPRGQIVIYVEGPPSADKAAILLSRDSGRDIGRIGALTWLCICYAALAVLLLPASWLRCGFEWVSRGVR